VVAIIAVLIAMLLPSLSSARNEAKKIVCLTNMHQFYTAVAAYAVDNSGRTVMMGNESDYGTWYPNYFNGWFLLKPYAKDVRIMDCPVNSYYTSESLVETVNDARWPDSMNMYTDYSYWGYCKVYDAGQVNPYWAGIRENSKQLGADPQACLLTDFTIWGRVMHPQMASCESIEAMNRSGNNHLFSDGHARFVKQIELDYVGGFWGGSGPDYTVINWAEPCSVAIFKHYDQ